MSFLQPTFLELVNVYQPDNRQELELWLELEHLYSQKKRHYHNLMHLENLLFQLNTVKGEVNDWDCLLFALFYHDSIYDVTANDNEEKSAELAKKRLQAIGFPAERTDRCVGHILAQKSTKRAAITTPVCLPMQTSAY